MEPKLHFLPFKDKLMVNCLTFVVFGLFVQNHSVAIQVLLQQKVFVANKLLQFHPLLLLDQLPLLTHYLCQQCFCHSCDQSLGNACSFQSILGYLLVRFLLDKILALFVLLLHFLIISRPKKLLLFLLVMVNYFIWIFPFEMFSVLGFSSLLSIIDDKDNQLWNFPTDIKHPPLQIIDYFLAMLQNEGITPITIHFDEDGALAQSTEFTDFLCLHHLTLEITGGYASWLIGKIERPHRTIANKAHIMLFNSGLSNKF
jgi:hypothetical protein